jgi:hypothetical protein
MLRKIILSAEGISKGDFSQLSGNLSYCSKIIFKGEQGADKKT